MRTIIVDDEKTMLCSFMRLSEGIEGLNVVGQFETAEDALAYAKQNSVELAILDIAMPEMDGLELAAELRRIRNDMLIVFISAHDTYLRASNQLGVDYYIVKPYHRRILEEMMDRMRLLAKRLEKNVYIRTFGRFMILKNGHPISLTGKPKEILALVTVQRGKEISNEEIYTTIWEGRPYGNVEMKVYYNAIRRLKDNLAKADLSGLLVSTTRGQFLNTDLVDCDYFAWQDNNLGPRDRFQGEFLSEYSWGESFLSEIIQDRHRSAP